MNIYSITLNDRMKFFFVTALLVDVVKVGLCYGREKDFEEKWITHSNNGNNGDIFRNSRIVLINIAI